MCYWPQLWAWLILFPDQSSIYFEDYIWIGSQVVTRDTNPIERPGMKYIESAPGVYQDLGMVTPTDIEITKTSR